MTGIERLRELIDATLGYVRVASVTPHDYEYENDVEWDERMHLSELLASIYSQISREQDAMVVDSPYNALPQEDREAIAWVRDHGGLERVKKLLDWVVGHCSTKQQLDFDFWLSGRVMHELGFDEDMADRDEVERRLAARLMPEGVEWPRHESGELVGFGDDVSRLGEVFSISLYCDGSFALNFRAYSKGERVKRPAPKVLDADGVEIRVGDDLYGCESGRGPFRVVETLEDSAEVKLKSYLNGSEFTTCAATFTHRAPVLAADGEPLEVGQTVYDVDAETDTPLTVVEVSSDLVRCEYTWKDGKTYRPCYPPDQLTHQRPDTWQRIEEDAMLSPHSYICACGKHDDAMPKSVQMSIDLVRRCRALAERERGE